MIIKICIIALIFATFKFISKSFLQHQVTPVTKGVRKSLVMWFGGEPFK